MKFHKVGNKFSSFSEEEIRGLFIERVWKELLFKEISKEMVEKLTNKSEEIVNNIPVNDLCSLLKLVFQKEINNEDFVLVDYLSKGDTFSSLEGN